MVGRGRARRHPIPPTVHALLAGRLEQLEASERRVLEGAAVVGEVFEWSAVAELVPSELRPELGGHLMSLVRKDVIRPAPSDLSGEDAFRFRHLLIRDAAYDGIGKGGAGGASRAVRPVVGGGGS